MVIPQDYKSSSDSFSKTRTRHLPSTLPSSHARGSLPINAILQLTGQAHYCTPFPITSKLSLKSSAPAPGGCPGIACCATFARLSPASSSSLSINSTLRLGENCRRWAVFCYTNHAASKGYRRMPVPGLAGTETRRYHRFFVRHRQEAVDQPDFAHSICARLPRAQAAQSSLICFTRRPAPRIVSLEV